MNGRKVQELQRAIGTLTQEELQELRLWLDEYAGPSPLDRRIESDLAAGRLDKAVQSALGESRGHEVWSARVTLNYRALALKRTTFALRNFTALLTDFYGSGSVIIRLTKS